MIGFSVFGLKFGNLLWLCFSHTFRIIMHCVGYILLVRLLLCAVTVNGHLPIEQNFINTFGASDTNVVNYRLPNNTKPEHYAIALATNVDKNDFNFTGEVTIKLRALEPTKNITIHQRQLKIVSVSLRSLSSGKRIIVTHDYDKITEFLEISAEDELEKGQSYFLTITYSGEFGDFIIAFLHSLPSVD